MMNEGNARVPRATPIDPTPVSKYKTNASVFVPDRLPTLALRRE